MIRRPDIIAFIIFLVIMGFSCIRSAKKKKDDPYLRRYDIISLWVTGIVSFFSAIVAFIYWLAGGN